MVGGQMRVMELTSDVIRAKRKFEQRLHMTRRSITPKSWRRYTLSGLNVVPSVAGAAHTIIAQGLHVEVRLPSKPTASSTRSHEERLVLAGYRMKDSRKVPLQYAIRSVDVLITLKRPVTVPKNSLGKVDSSLFRKGVRHRLDELTSRAEAVSDEVFDYWLRVIRWKTRNGAIGQPQFVGSESGWGTYLLEKTSEQRFYAGSHRIVVTVTQPLSKRQWNATQDALARSLQPPIWFEFLFDGQHRLRVGDLHGSVLSLAIACESLFRALLTRHAREPRNDDFIHLINQVPVMRLLERWPKLGFSGTKWKTAYDRNELKKLFECRNRIVHRGHIRKLNRDDCMRYGKVHRTWRYRGPTARCLT